MLASASATQRARAMRVRTGSTLPPGTGPRPLLDDLLASTTSSLAPSEQLAQESDAGEDLLGLPGAGVECDALLCAVDAASEEEQPNLGVGTTRERIEFHRRQQEQQLRARAARIDMATGATHTPVVLPKSRLLLAAREAAGPRLRTRARSISGPPAESRVGAVRPQRPSTSSQSPTPRMQELRARRLEDPDPDPDDTGVVLFQPTDDDEEARERVREQRQKTTDAACNRLWRDAQLAQQRRRDLEQRLQRQELEDCTFVPVLNDPILTIKEQIGTRSERWLQFRDQKIGAIREFEKDKDLVGCTFAPELNMWNPPRAGGRLAESQRDDACQGSFVARLQRARQLQEQKRDEMEALERKHVESYTGKLTKCQEFKKAFCAASFSVTPKWPGQAEYRKARPKPEDPRQEEPSLQDNGAPASPETGTK
eukprot:m51a1_g5950 hypothetical protein (426) ;mRNA; f:136373-138079